jgi:hypothetical protein
MLGAMYQEKNGTYVHFSATHVYQRRSNKPSGGMIGVNALDIAREGVTLEELVPSQMMTDAQMDGVKIPEYKHEVGKIFKVSNYLVIKTMDIDTIASIIQTTGKPVMVWYWFKHDEWTDKPNVKYPTLSVQDGSRHSVTAVDFCLINGKKHLIIDDSWGTRYGEKGQRAISEDFHKKRNFFAAYMTNFKFADGEQQQDSSKPKYTFTKDLEYIPSAPIVYNQPDVVALQDCLRFEGCFPVNSKSTGYFGSVTKSAVEKFQVKHKIAGKGDAGYGRCGPKTRAKLNDIFSK